MLVLCLSNIYRCEKCTFSVTPFKYLQVCTFTVYFCHWCTRSCQRLLSLCSLWVQRSGSHLQPTRPHLPVAYTKMHTDNSSISFCLESMPWFECHPPPTIVLFCMFILFSCMLQLISDNHVRWILGATISWCGPCLDTPLPDLYNTFSISASAAFLPALTPNDSKHDKY